MTIEIVTIPCRSDNFAYLIRRGDRVAVIDAPEAGPIADALDARGWPLHEVLITHHHSDHTAGAEALRARYGARLAGPAAEAARLPPLDLALADGDGDAALGWRVIAVPGHTLGHIAYHLPEAGALFSADSLMAAGCGRVFEGTPAMMWDSLSRLAALPAETRVWSGHDYLDGNIAFALTLEPDNSALILRGDRVAQMRRDGQLPMPWTLREEAETNPFLRAALPQMKVRMGLPDAPDAEVFAAVRAAKDKF